MKLSHIISSIVLFAMITVLFQQAYNELTDNYGLTRTDTIDDFNVMDALVNLQLISGLNQTVSSVFKIADPNANLVDLAGALVSAGIGTVKLVIGVFTFVPEIIFVISQYYHIPPIIPIGFIVMFLVYLGFILLKAYTTIDL